MRRALKIAALLLAGTLGCGAAGANELPTDLAGLESAAVERLAALLKQNETRWHRSEARDVDFNLRRGTIHWKFDDRLAFARVELLGVWARSSGKMLWGWRHPLAPRGTAVASARLRRYAVEHAIEELTRPEIDCALSECEVLAGMAVMIGNLNGIHRVELTPGETTAFLGFGRVKELKENGR